MLYGTMRSNILLDFDGVIVDSIEIFSRTVEVAAQELNRPITFHPEDLRVIKRMSIEAISDYVQVDRSLIPEFLEVMDRELHRVAYEIPLFPDMAEVIQRLSEWGRLGIVSATPAPVIAKVLRNHCIDHYFERVIGGDTPGPKSVKISSIIQETDSSEEATCMIGDTISDIEQGKNVGVRTIAVSWGWHSVEWLKSAKPDFIARQPHDLIKFAVTNPNQQPITVH